MNARPKLAMVLGFGAALAAHAGCRGSGSDSGGSAPGSAGKVGGGSSSGQAAVAGASSGGTSSSGASGAGGAGAVAGATTDAGVSGMPSGSAAGSPLDASAADAAAGSAGAAPKDAGPTDAAPCPWCDAGAGGSLTSSSWPGWTRWSPPGGCDVYKPNDLAAAVSPATWSDCGGVSGCQKLDTPWADTNGTALSLVTFQKASGGSETLFATEVTQSSTRFVAVMFSSAMGGSPIGAWGSAASCWQAFPFDDRFLALRLSGTGTSNIDLFWGAAAEVATATKPNFSFLFSDPGFSEFSDTRLGSNLMAWSVAGVVAMRLDTLTPFAIDIGYQYAGDTNTFVGDTLFFRTSEPDTKVFVRHADGSLEVLLTPVYNWVGTLSTDGTDMAWFQYQYDMSSGSPVLQKTELWTSPYAEHASDLKPRRLEGVYLDATHAGGRLWVRHGFAGYDSFPPRSYRLSDGAYYQAPAQPTPDLAWSKPVFFDETEMIWTAKTVCRDRTVVRVPLASMQLMPPDP